MQSIKTHSPNDPVSRLIDRNCRAWQRFPVPLLATSYDITISGGLADIVAKRTFHNGEAQSIEAAITFPVPVEAVLYALEAKIGDRVVNAVAKAKDAARATYEDAIDFGKTAVLHEELLKGIHMLSVGHIPAGTIVVVTARFVMSLAWIGGRALLRIPTTVGDVYGDAGLPDADALVHGSTLLAGDVCVRSDAGTPVLLGGTLAGGAARVWLDSPINIEVKDWAPRTLTGRAADGRSVSLDIAPAPAVSTDLDAAVLVDRSGSMADSCAAGTGLTKHGAVLLGLAEAGRDLTSRDRINLWQFDDVAEDLGSASASSWSAIIRHLSPPNGGTEIGGAIGTLLAERPVRDVLLVTDGKSYALDVQKLAARGVRFTLVLIGDDSLEANAGHLASLSGGTIFIPEGADVAAAVRSALASMRSPRAAGEAGDTSRANRLHVCRCGMAVTAAWTGPGFDVPGTATSRAAGAYAASLRLTALPEAEAATLAEAEGLVTHLTSLVLVDEDGAKQIGLPVMRKVELPSPATYVPGAAGPALRSCYIAPMHERGTGFAACARPAASMPMLHSQMDCRPAAKGVVKRALSSYDDGYRERSLASLRRKRERMRESEQAAARKQVPAAAAVAEPDASRIESIAHILHRVDWFAEARRLAGGNMIGLPADVADTIDEAAAYGLVRRIAKRLGLTPRLLVIGLLARAASGYDRHADRVARAVLAKAKTRDIADLAGRLGLTVARSLTA